MALSETDARATMGVDVARAWRSRVTTRLAAATVSLATVIVVIGVAVAAFFNPLWIGIEQERASVPAITGYTPEQVGDATGSSVCNGSGTIPAQTTIWYAVLINQVGRAQCSQNPKGISSFSPALTRCNRGYAGWRIKNEINPE